MKKLISIAAAAATALSLAVVAQPAQARDGGAVAAGVVGGLAAGAIIGSAASRPYYGPAYYDGYYASAPGPYCHWERTQWIDSWGRPHFRRVRVCD